MTAPVSWKQVQDAIKAAIVFTGGVATGAVVWADEQRLAAKTLAILNIVELTAMQDREDFVADDVGDGFHWELSTLYYIRVQIRTESIYNAPGSDALIALERIRAGLLRPDLVLAAGVVLQPDVQTFVHHLSFPGKDGRILNAYALEMGFRAIVDAPLSGAIEAGPNMQEVIVDGAADDGETPTPQLDQTVDRPA